MAMLSYLSHNKIPVYMRCLDLTYELPMEGLSEREDGDILKWGSTLLGLHPASDNHNLTSKG